MPNRIEELHKELEKYEDLEEVLKEEGKEIPQDFVTRRYDELLNLVQE